MNPLDLGVIGVVALSAIFAFARGFVREALSIIAWVGAAIVTLYCFNWVYAQIDPRVHNALLSQVITGFSLFVGSLIVLTILTGMAARMVRIAGLTPIDRTLGFIFGLVRGAFLVCLAYLLLDASVQPNDRPGWIREAKSGPYLHEGADMLRGFLPESLKVKSADALDDAVKSLSSPADQARAAMGAYAKPAATAPLPPAPTTPPPTPAANPQAPQAAPPPQAPTYTPNDKRELDRLIGTQR
ncbi:MAG TPA: CvpA family protein [Stellaceae bacterium]|jgi:membrane protein required for colicin V production|nr:CvpA family protein [Stellaceae bacterium]